MHHHTEIEADSLSEGDTVDTSVHGAALLNGLIADRGLKLVIARGGYYGVWGIGARHTCGRKPGLAKTCKICEK